jgi:hypothetical protein
MCKRNELTAEPSEHALGEIEARVQRRALSQVPTVRHPLFGSTSALSLPELRPVAEFPIPFRN